VQFGGEVAAAGMGVVVVDLLSALILLLMILITGLLDRLRV